MHAIAAAPASCKPSMYETGHTLGYHRINAVVDFSSAYNTVDHDQLLCIYGLASCRPAHSGTPAAQLYADSVTQAASQYAHSDRQAAHQYAYSGMQAAQVFVTPPWSQCSVLQVCKVETATETDAAQQPPPCNTSFEQLDPEQQVQCGRKLLERAMLGDPLYEEEAEEVSEMQTQTTGDTQAPSRRGEGADSITSSSSGAFVEAALGPASSNEVAQHAQHGECALHTDTLASSQQSGPAVGPQAAQHVQHAQQAAQHAQQATHSNVGRHQNQPQAALQSNLHTTENFSPSSNHMPPPAEPAATSESSHHARDMPGSHVDSHQAAPSVAASSMADRDQEQDREDGGRPWLKRAFSMVERENLNVDYESMNSLDKVGHRNTVLNVSPIV